MLEHYLVSYVHRTLFPLGPLEGSIRDHCLLLLVHYAVIQTVLIGVAGFHKTEFNTGHAIQVIQSATKTFAHSLTFPAHAMKILARAQHGKLRRTGDADAELVMLAAWRKVPDAGERPCESQPVRRRDHLLISHRAAGLDHRRNAVPGGLFDAIGKWEKRVRGEHRAL